jgi:hypothetical protein
MNVLDFPETELPTDDRLRAIFLRQHQLMEKYEGIEHGRGANVVDPEDFGEIDNRFVQWRIKDLMQRCIEEMMEAANCLKNKQWKQTETPTDRVHFYEEIADALHFFIEMCITAGMDDEDLALIYLKKAEVNQFRQESMY